MNIFTLKNGTELTLDQVRANLVMLGMLVFSPLILLYDAWITRLLWIWFVSPIFQVGAPGVFAVAGLELVVFQFVRQFIPGDMRDWAVVKEFLGWTFVGPACFLAFGWAFKHFI